MTEQDFAQLANQWIQNWERTQAEAQAIPAGNAVDVSPIPAQAQTPEPKLDLHEDLRRVHERLKEELGSSGQLPGMSKDLHLGISDTLLGVDRTVFELKKLRSEAERVERSRLALEHFGRTTLPQLDAKLRRTYRSIGIQPLSLNDF